LHFGNVLLRRTALDTVEPFDPRLSLASEWRVWLQLERHHRVGYIDDPLFCYRLHPGAHTFTGSHDTGEWERQAFAIVNGFYAQPDLPVELRARQELSLANVSLTVGLLQAYRREWRAAGQSLWTAWKLTPWRRLADLVNASAIVPRLLTRARMLAEQRLRRHRTPLSGRAMTRDAARSMHCPTCGGVSTYPVRAMLPVRPPGTDATGRRCLACGQASSAVSEPDPRWQNG
jgi:hypothetical protein